MEIETIPTGAFQENCYLVWNTAKQAAVIDPGADAEIIQQVLNRYGLTVAGYILTHTHADHINALADLHKKFPAPVAVHSDDLAWAFEPYNQIPPYYPVPAKPQVDDFLRLESGNDWEFIDLYFQCIETPGHTPGSCCLLFPEGNFLLTGDTLFKGSCGRTDLPGGDSRKLKASLNRLKQLPDEIRVFPGHGPDTTIGIERLTNFYMQ